MEKLGRTRKLEVRGGPGHNLPTSNVQQPHQADPDPTEAEQDGDPSAVVHFGFSGIESATWDTHRAPPGSRLDPPGGTATRLRSVNDDQGLRGPLVFAYGLVFPCYQRCRGVCRALRGAWWRFKISVTLVWIPDTILHFQHQSETFLRNQPMCSTPMPSRSGFINF